METNAALMTGKGAAAISCITIVGPKAKEVISKITKPASNVASRLQKESLILTEIMDSERIVDQVLVACEGDDKFTINAHGNPILVESIMELLKSNGVKLISGKEMLMLEALQKNPENLLAAEASVEHIYSKTIAGAKLIFNQKTHGLSKLANLWLKETSPSKIQTSCAEVLENTKVAELIISGAKVMIAGAPNSGKSTLLNQICGKQKAIVADIAGTTRDWVSATTTADSLEIEFFDTAGLDEELATKTKLDKVSQEATLDLFKQANLLLYLIDAQNPKKINLELLHKYAPKDIPVISVLNKIDKGEIAPHILDDFHVDISIIAESGKNVNELISLIEEKLAVVNFELTEAIFFKERHKKIAREILDCGQDIDKIKSLLNKLINPKG